MLYKDPVDKNKTMLPSPEDLKFKVNKTKNIEPIFTISLFRWPESCLIFSVYFVTPLYPHSMENCATFLSTHKNL